MKYSRSLRNMPKTYPELRYEEIIETEQNTPHQSKVIVIIAAIALILWAIVVGFGRVKEIRHDISVSSRPLGNTILGSQNNAADNLFFKAYKQ